MLILLRRTTKKQRKLIMNNTHTKKENEMHETNTQLTAKERESLALLLMNASSVLGSIGPKIEELLLDGGYEKTPQALAEIDDATNYPAIQELCCSFRAIAMRLDRSSLIKSQAE